MGERRGMKALELWCKKVTDGYPGVKVENMTTSWRDGLAFCALIHHFRPDLIDFPSLEKGDVYRNNELAFRTAERHLGIPALLDAEDMALYEVPDRLSILTYLSQFYQVFASQGNSPVKRSPEPAERSLVLGSSVPTPPPKERSCAIRRKEPCRKCGLPVFLAQRLVVDGHLHHRTCFRCARCDTQLTLANYYETMDGVYCCETCPDEEPNDSNSGSVIGGDKDDVNVAKDICSDNSVTLDNDNQLTTAIEKTEELVSSRNKSLVGIRKMMFENIAHKKDVSELTDDDKVVIKTKKGSRDDKFSSDNGDKNVNKSFIKSDKINSSSSVDCSVELMVNKISDFNLDTGDSNVKSIIVNNEQVTNKLSDAINNKNNKISDLPFIDSEHEYRSDSVNIVENIIKENDNEALDKNIQGVVCEQNESNLEESHDFVEPICNLPKDVNIPNELVKEDLKQLCDQDTYLDMKSLLNDDTTVEVSEPIYEEISEVKSYSNVPVTILVQEDVEEKMNDSVDISVSVEHPNVTESIKNDMEDGIEKLDYEVEDQNVVVNLEDTAEKEKEDKTIVEDQTKPAIILSVENNENVDEVITEKAEQSDSIDYPSQLNPFGDDEDDTEDMNNQTISTNPFESDMEDEEEEKSINEKATLVPVPAARANKSSYSENLNPFWSGSEEEEDEKSSLLSPPVPLPRKLKTPQMSPTPIMRSSRHRKTSSVGSGSNFVTAESQSPLKKKSPAPVPPSQNSTLKKRKAKPPPPPPPLPLSSRSPTPSVSSDLSTPVTPIMGEKVKKNSSNQENQFSDNTLPRNKSTFGQWKRKKGQAPPPPLPQRRTVKPMPLKQVRQELADIEIKQQELERQGVTLEQTIRDKFDQESSMTPYVEELVLQLFELVNEKNELFRRQAELMYLRRQHNLEEEHAELEYQIRCLMLCPEHNKTDYDKEREEELIKRLVDVVERRNSVVQCLEMDRLREAEEDRSVNAQLGSFSAAAIGSEIDLTNCDKKDKKHKKDKKKEIDVCSTLGRDTEAGEKMHKYKKLKKKWFTLQHQKKS